MNMIVRVSLLMLSPIHFLFGVPVSSLDTSSVLKAAWPSLRRSFSIEHSPKALNSGGVFYGKRRISSEQPYRVPYGDTKIN